MKTIRLFSFLQPRRRVAGVVGSQVAALLMAVLVAPHDLPGRAAHPEAATAAPDLPGTTPSTTQELS